MTARELSFDASRCAGDIPAGLSSFLGRASDLAELAALLERSRLLTLTGAPGIGKSRLALEGARRLHERYPDGARLAELAVISDPALILPALAAVLSVQESPGCSLSDAVVAHLRKRCLLLVLDNCEHLVTPCAELVARLLGACPQLSILATSREALGITGETVWQVPALNVPDPGEAFTSDRLLDFGAVQLFVERATAVQLEFELTAEHAGPIVEIVRRLDGIPLAIELAAACVGTLTPTEIASGLDHRFDLLTRGSRAALPRHRTLHAALDWSYELLSVDERELLRRLSVFTGGFCLDACEVVCGGAEDTDVEVFHLLAGLGAKSLVIANTANSRGRYRLLETVRAYAGERLLEAGATDSSRTGHARFYLDLAERAEPELVGSSQTAWLERLDLEHGNLRCALRWSLASGQDEWALRLAAALIIFWRVRCHFSVGRDLLEETLAARHDDHRQLRARVLWGAGFLTVMAGDPEGARPALEESLAECRELADSGGAARALLILGNGRIYSDLAGQLAQLHESARLACEAGDLWCLSHALGAAGYAHLNIGDLPPARPLFEQGVAVARQADDLQGLRYGLLGLGSVARCQGDYPAALALLEEALSIARSLGEALMESDALCELGALEFGRGRYEHAGALAVQATSSLPAAAPVAQIFGPLLNLARVAHAQGQPRRALSLLAEVQALVAAHGISGSALQMVGELAAAEGDAAKARPLFEDVLRRARTFGHHRSLAAQALSGLGRLARSAGEVKKAAALHDEALELRHQIEEKPEIAASLEAVGGLAAAAGRAEDAARLLGAAGALRARGGYARDPWLDSLHEADLALASRELSAEQFEAASRAGAALSLDDAIGLASIERKRNGQPGSGWTSLTPREREVIALAADGLTNPAIAGRLGISRATVKTHLLHVFSKLGVTTRRELEAEARRRRDC